MNEYYTKHLVHFGHLWGALDNAIMKRMEVSKKEKKILLKAVPGFIFALK